MRARPRQTPWELRHILAVALGLGVFATIFLYTGEGEVMAAAFSGLGGALLVYAGAHLAARLHNGSP